MYYCENCKNEFDEPKRKNITYEDFYEVGNLFTDRHKMTILVCPHCESEDIEEMVQCDRCEEFFRENDLIDTEEMVGGNIGLLCCDCAKDCEIGGV